MAQTVAAPFGSEPVDGNGASRSRVGFWTLAIGSIGVVYGDIGTSPLYAMRESLLAAVGPDAPASTFAAEEAPASATDPSGC